MATFSQCPHRTENEGEREKEKQGEEEREKEKEIKDSLMSLLIRTLILLDQHLTLMT